MRKTLTALLLGLAAAASSPAFDLVATQWPPFTGRSGEPGVAIDLVHNALARIGVRATSRIVADGEVNQILASGRADGSPAMWKSPERERELLYSHPILENRLVLVGRMGTDVSATDLRQLSGKKVALVDGYAYGPDLPVGPAYVMGASPQANLDALRSGRVDYMLAEDLFIRYLGRHQPKETRTYLAFGTRSLLTRSLHFALRRDLPGAASTMVQFNSKLREMLRTGEYHRILGFRWIRADVDGDGKLELVADGLKAGREPPVNPYSIDSDDRLERAQHGGERYSVGGRVFDSWKAVPDTYKVPVPRKEDVVGNTGAFYTF